MSIRLGVVGSRRFEHLSHVWGYLDGREDEVDCVVSGGARGVDSAAEEWGDYHDKTVVSFRPVADPETRGLYRISRVTTMCGRLEDSCLLPGVYKSWPAAAFVRNGFICEFADEVVAFWDGESRGTADSIKRARELGNLRDIVRA